MATTSIWVVLTVLGKIGGVAGPLPYDMAECQHRVYEMNADVQKQLAIGHGVNGEELDDQVRSLQYFCRESRVKPVMGDEYPPAL